MPDRLNGKKVAFLLTDGVEQVELTEPWNKVQDEGGTPELVSLEGGQIQGFNHLDKGDRFDVDKTVAEADAGDYDGLVLPGGVANPDFLRADADAVAFMRAFFEAGKPVASICHGPWTLVEADVVRGRTLTSWPSLRTDIKNAGGNVGGRGGARRQRAGDEPQARRPARLQRQARRGDRGGPARGAGPADRPVVATRRRIRSARQACSSLAGRCDRTPSSTRSTRARSRTPTATESGIFPGSSRGSTT